MFIGCSGWSFEDWVGRFYPVSFSRKKEEWLRYYSNYFNTVEINSTFFRAPEEFTVNGWIKKAATLKGFEFSVKMPQTVTHDALAKNEGERAGVLASSFEATCVRPLANSELLGAALLQMSPSFRNVDDSREALRDTLKVLDTDVYRYAVEFRHRSWFEAGSDELDIRAYELLRSFNVANAITDGPEGTMSRKSSADHAYFRFHGRGREVWTDEDREEDLRLSRYDHLYSDEEIAELAVRIKEGGADMTQARAYFCNSSKAKGAKNALRLMDVLDIPHKEKEIQVDNHSPVGPFLMSKS